MKKVHELLSQLRNNFLTKNEKNNLTAIYKKYDKPDSRKVSELLNLPFDLVQKFFKYLRNKKIKKDKENKNDKDNISK